MFPFNLRTALCLSLLLFFFAVSAQRPAMYGYKDLSKTYYKKQRDSIEEAWKCPVIFSDKETQKKYKEIWDDRTKFVTGAFDDNSYVYEKELLNYVNDIISQLMKANPTLFKSAPLVLIDRSVAVNAYAAGGNVLAVNLGLISFCESREELALVLAHELSHNTLSHAENAMKDRAQLLTSDEYKESLNSVLNSKYERLTRLKKILQSYSFDRNRHRRYHEDDADSMAIRMLKNAKLAFDARFFLRLDSADTHYQQPLKQDLSKYFAQYDIAIDEAWTKKKSRGLSSRNYNFKDSTVDADSLKTHPDCEKRFEKNRALTDAGKTLTPIPAHLHELSTKFSMWNSYNNNALTTCLYRILLERDKGNQDPWYDFMFSNVISGLYYADRELHRFASIGVVPKEYVSADYFKLQTLFEQVPRENLEAICRKLQNASFLSKLTADEKSFRKFMGIISLDQETSAKYRAAAASAFADDYPNSAYREFASPFDKK